MILPGIYDIFQEKWKNYQTFWLISDSHFNEPDLEEAYLDRPTAEEFVRLINSKVGRKDIICCLGDCGDLEYWKKIRGYKILIMGNHDQSVEKCRDVFQEVYQGPVMFGEKLILSHEPIPSIDWAYNLHGHNHNGPIAMDAYHLNINCDANKCYLPINFNLMLKKGLTSQVKPLHRKIIDTASIRKRKRK